MSEPNELFLKNSLLTAQKLLVNDEAIYNLSSAKEKIVQCKEKGGRLFLAGNGASSSIASHAALDFSKQAKVPSFALSDDAVISAYANDYGFENWISRYLIDHANQNDIFICVSVSGESSNLVNGLMTCKASGIFSITFSGTNNFNSCSKLGDISLFVESKAYNIVEGVHMIWLTAIIDLIIGKTEYAVGDQ